VDGADGDHRGVRGVEPPGHDRLQRADQGACAHYWVRGFVRPRAMCAGADQLYVERVGRGGERPGFGHHLSHLEAAVHVRAEDGGRVVESARLQDHQRAGAGLFGRLQHHDHVARRGLRRQQVRGSNGPRRVHIVSASVHHAGIA
jgi:hypothetical protein